MNKKERERRTEVKEIKLTPENTNKARIFSM